MHHVLFFLSHDLYELTNELKINEHIKEWGRIIPVESDSKGNLAIFTVHMQLTLKKYILNKSYNVIANIILLVHHVC